MCVFHSDEVMKEADANGTSRYTSQGALWKNLRLGLEMLCESASWFPLLLVVLCLSACGRMVMNICHCRS